MSEEIKLVVDDSGNIISEDDLVLIMNDDGNYEYINKEKLFPHNSGSNSTMPQSQIETSSENDAEGKLWTHENILLLISLYEKFAKTFEKSIKKHIWQKIATEMVNATGKKFTYVQVDTKWKGLVKTYKDVQKHNNTSGKNRKQWQYFELMHDILYQKPEINPVATCSNLSGLQVRTSTVSPATPTTSRKIDFESSFSKKRKSKEDAVERRHAEKMQRLDKLQSSIDKMLEALTK